MRISKSSIVITFSLIAVVGFFLVRLTSHEESRVPIQPTITAEFPTPTPIVSHADVILGDYTTQVAYVGSYDPKICESAVDQINAYQSDTLSGPRVVILATDDGIDVREYTSGSAYRLSDYTDTGARIIGQIGNYMTQLSIVRCKRGIAIAELTSVSNILSVITTEEFDECAVTTSSSVEVDSLKGSTWTYGFQHYDGEIYVNVFLSEPRDGIDYYAHYVVELDSLVSRGYTTWTLSNGYTVIVYRYKTHESIAIVPTGQLSSICR